MDDDANQHDVDARLRDILQPPAAAVDRVVSGALRRQQSNRRLHRWRWATVTGVGLLIVAAVAWQRAGGRQPPMPAAAAVPRSGHYVIVVPALEVAP